MHIKAQKMILSGRYGDLYGRPGDWCRIRETPKRKQKGKEKKRKTEPKELPSCTIPLLLISYTRELEILAIALELTSKIWYFYNYTDTLAA